tara:strand:+ start:122 stop:487 length:366 start_codon:yes stop_codon:yes gene_type:complete
MNLSYNQTFLKIFSSLFSNKAGEDQYGNSYYSNNKVTPSNNYREKRWVIYNGNVEASKVPPQWNAWLHHVTNQIPRAHKRKPHWLKEHLPNPTGTKNAIKPKNIKQKEKINNTYSIWDPND